MCSFSVDDPAEVFRLTHHRARKTHSCRCCRKSIRPGEHYEREFMVADGEAFTSKLCECCAFARKLFCDDEHHEGTPSADWFRECLRECFVDDLLLDKRDPETKLWRDLYAGIVRRERAAKREVHA